LAGRARKAAVAPTTDVASDPQAAAGDLRAHLEVMESHLAWSNEQLLIAQELNDEAGILTFSRLYKEFSAAVLANRLAQLKLGVDVGELLPRTEVARLFWAFASRAALAIQRIRDQLGPRLVGLSNEAEVVSRLEPTLLTELFISPWARATNLAAAIGLPGWVITDLRRAFADHIAQGDHQLTSAQAAEASATH
jgi:hypothetical protein